MSNAIVTQGILWRLVLALVLLQGVIRFCWMADKISYSKILLAYNLTSLVVYFSLFQDFIITVYD